jgi:hypothetical protein
MYQSGYHDMNLSRFDRENKNLGTFWLNLIVHAKFKVPNTRCVNCFVTRVAAFWGLLASRQFLLG